MAERIAVRPQVYRIRVKERLDPHWSEWLDGLAVEYGDADGSTSLCGPIIDQAALHGVLMKIRDMGLTLLSVARVDPDRDPLA